MGTKSSKSEEGDRVPFPELGRMRIDQYQLHHGDALAVLRDLDADSVDALICDPPYSSGGAFRSDRNQTPNAKYQSSGTERAYATFSGDNRDARSYRYWTQLWLSEALRVVRPSGYALIFSDWRQLPTTTDALQAAGFVWRGIVAWDKGRGARAGHTGLFRHQAEYVVWGTKGPSRPALHGGPWDGVIRATVRQSDKHHVTGKPTELMRALVRIVPPGGTILDPMAGSFTTGVAAVLEGRRFVGIEQEAAYVEIGRKRMEEAAQQVTSSGKDFEDAA